MARITIKAARTNAGFTQEQIAAKLGISRAFYNDIETGRVEAKPVYIYAICQVTGFSTDDIILPLESTKR